MMKAVVLGVKHDKPCFVTYNPLESLEKLLNDYPNMHQIIKTDFVIAITKEYYRKVPELFDSSGRFLGKYVIVNEGEEVLN